MNCLSVWQIAGLVLTPTISLIIGFALGVGTRTPDPPL